MKQNTKNDIKEWAQIMLITTIALIVVHHINSLFTSEKPREKTQQTVTPSNSAKIATQDTVAQHFLRNAKQLKR